MFFELKTLLDEKINKFYLIIFFNVIIIFFGLLCLASIPLFVGSIFNPDVILSNFYQFGLDEFLKFKLKQEDIFFYSSIFLVGTFLLKNLFNFIYIFQDSFLKILKFLSKENFRYYLNSPYFSQIRIIHQAF